MVEFAKPSAKLAAAHIGDRSAPEVASVVVDDLNECDGGDESAPDASSFGGIGQNFPAVIEESSGRSRRRWWIAFDALDQLVVPTLEQCWMGRPVKPEERKRTASASKRMGGRNQHPGVAKRVQKLERTGGGVESVDEGFGAVKISSKGGQ